MLLQVEVCFLAVVDLEEEEVKVGAMVEEIGCKRTRLIGCKRTRLIMLSYFRRKQVDDRGEREDSK